MLIKKFYLPYWSDLGVVEVVEVDVTVWYCGGGGGAESQHSRSGNSLAKPVWKMKAKTHKHTMTLIAGIPVVYNLVQQSH